MEDREDKLIKAREKLDKFRKKKQRNPESASTTKPGVNIEDDHGQGKASTSPTPTISPPVEVFPAPSSNREEESLTSTLVNSSESSTVPAVSVVEEQSNLSSYFGSTVSDAAQQFYIGSADGSVAGDAPVDAGNDIPAEEEHQHQLGSPAVSSEDSSQFSIISSNTENIQETIRRNESFNDNLKILALEQRCAGLEKDLQEERGAKSGLHLEINQLEQEKERLQSELAQRLAEAESVERTEVTRLEAELSARSQTIELLVGEKSELQSLADELLGQKQALEETKVGLERSVEQLGSACSELREQVVASTTQSCLQQEVERQSQALQETLRTREQSYTELQTKLSQLRSEHDSLQEKHRTASSELEMCKVHLTQLRSGAGSQNLLRAKEQEMEKMSQELGVTRSNLMEAMARISQLGGERDSLAEQYRGYSRDLASQAERLGEQLAKYQQENARLVTREAGLVQHVSRLERELQVGSRGGGGEELVKLKERINTTESELRLAREEKVKLEEMVEARGVQVDEMTSRLGSKDNEIMELRASLSGLETTVDMLRSTSLSSGDAQAQLLAACESDKVAASRAMQQNLSLKQRLEELQGALVSLTNSKADLVDRLDSAQRKISGYSDVQAELAARDEAIKEKDIMLGGLRQDVKHLTDQLRRLEEQEEGTNNDNETFLLRERELEQARDVIRSLNSQNSELRSKLEVLSSNTRECSETRSNTSEEIHQDDMADTSFSESSSSESFEELSGDKSPSVPAAPSSDSFVNVKDVGSVEETVINTSDLPFVPHQSPANSFQHLENRFIKAMEQIAKLSLDKEQLEHLVARLQDETETIGDYVVMYQHQRHQQKLKMAEKEEQLQQLAKDRAELSSKLEILQTMVTSVMAGPDQGTREATAEVAVSEKMKETLEKEKILELIADIGSDSAQMMATCDKFQPWFWEQSQHKVMTV